MLCMREDPPAAESAPDSTGEVDTSLSRPGTESVSRPTEELADLSARGESCHARGEHDCVIDALSSAYDLLEHEDRVGRLGFNYIELMSDSCQALLMNVDVASYRSHFDRFARMIDLHVSEIDEETKRKNGRKPRSQRKKKLEEQKRRLQEQRMRLDGLRERLDLEAPTTVIHEPQEEGGLGPRDAPTDVEDGDHDGDEESGSPVEPTADAIDPTRRPIVLGTLGIIGGSLAILTGVSFMVNGAAWTLCNGKYRDVSGTPSPRCFELAGARDGLSLIAGFVEGSSPEDFEVPAGQAHQKASKNWVLGSLSTALGIGVVTWSAIAVKRARAQRKRSLSVAISWSPVSRREGGVSVSGRF